MKLYEATLSRDAPHYCPKTSQMIGPTAEAFVQGRYTHVVMCVANVAYTREVRVIQDDQRKPVLVLGDVVYTQNVG